MAIGIDRLASAAGSSDYLGSPCLELGRIVDRSLNLGPQPNGARSQYGDRWCDRTEFGHRDSGLIALTRRRRFVALSILARIQRLLSLIIESRRLLSEFRWTPSPTLRRARISFDRTWRPWFRSQKIDPPTRLRKRAAQLKSPLCAGISRQTNQLGWWIQVLVADCFT